ncbi:MAG: hypothetical protein ACOZDD_17620 [Bacteroidota bacterium]
MVDLMNNDTGKINHCETVNPAITDEWPVFGDKWHIRAGIQTAQYAFGEMWILFSPRKNSFCSLCRLCDLCGKKF